MSISIRFSGKFGLVNFQEGFEAREDILKWLESKPEIKNVVVERRYKNGNKYSNVFNPTEAQVLDIVGKFPTAEETRNLGWTESDGSKLIFAFEK